MRPRDEVGRLRRRLIAEQIADLVAIDRRLHEVGLEIKAAIAVTPTGLTRLFGVGPVATARVLGEVGDVARFVPATTSPATTAPPRSTPAAAAALPPTGSNTKGNRL